MSNSGIASPGTKIIASASNSFLQLTVVQSSLGLDAVDNNGTDTGSLTGGTGLTSVSSSPPSTSQVPGPVVVNNGNKLPFYIFSSLNFGWNTSYILCSKFSTVRAILNSGSKVSLHSSWTKPNPFSTVIKSDRLSMFQWVFKPTSNTDEFSIMLEQAELYLAYNLSGKKVIAATAPVTLDVKTSPTIPDAFQ